MDVELPDGRVIEGVPEGITRSELMRRLQLQEQRARQATPEYQAKLAAQQAADRAEFDPTKGMSGGEKIVANLAAGARTLGQGVQQLGAKVGLGEGPTDEDIEEKRRFDQTLAEGTTGGSALQLAGEVVPTLALPAAGLSRVKQLGPLSRTILTGMLGGASGAAVNPVTSEESRPVNMATAGVVGAALPLGLGGAAKGLQGGYKVFRKAGATKRAAEAIADRSGGLRETIRKLGGVTDDPVAAVRGREFAPPTSAAQATGDADLAATEAWSRSRPTTAADWQRFDAARNAELHRATQEMAPSDLRMGRLEAVRAGRTAPMREEALTEASAAGGFIDPVLQHVDALVKGDAGAIPSVATIANYVSKSIGPEATGAATPQRLYAVRKVLTDKLGGRVMPGDELGAAAKTARRETMGIVNAIDESLDNVTGGKWTPYLQEFAARSKPIKSGEAMREVAEKMDTKPLLGGSPQVTAAGLQSALGRTEGKFGSKLTPEDASATGSLLRHLREAEGVGRTRKLAATMGGGSITNTDQMLGAGMGRLMDAIPGVGGYATRLREYNQDLVEREIGRLMQQPTQLAAELRKLPPGRRTQLVIDVMREANAGAGAAAGASATQ